MIASATKSKRRLAFGLAVTGILFALSRPCLATVYKCTGPDGKVTYGDTPCAADDQSQQVTITPAAQMNSARNAVASPATSAGVIADSNDLRNREGSAGICIGKGVIEWQNAQGQSVSNPEVRAQKISEIRNQCRRQFGLPESVPPKPNPVVDCNRKRLAEYVQAQAQAVRADEVRAKMVEIDQQCKRSLGVPVTDSAAIATPKPSTQNSSAALQLPPSSATSDAVLGKNRDPLAVLNALADRIYSIGETSGNGAEMIAAEASAADEIRHYISNGSTDGLLAKEKDKQSPLAVAAYMGYPNVVAALLTSDVVRTHISDADDKGLTPWIAANLSIRQSIAACNPSIWDDPFKFVPVLVTQPYYILNPTPPYAKAREVLQKAGAASDILKAKEVWLSLCKNQSSGTRTKVQASTDLQKTVQEVGAAALTAKILELQKKAAEAQKK